MVCAAVCTAVCIVVCTGVCVRVCHRHSQPSLTLHVHVTYFRYEENYTETVDIYAFGMLLVELITLEGEKEGEGES